MSTALFLLACILLAYSGFCRLVHTTQATVPAVRLAIYALTIAAVVCAAAVLVWAYQPGWPAAVLAAAMAGLQLASARLWSGGVPMGFDRPRPRRR